MNKAFLLTAFLIIGFIVYPQENRVSEQFLATFGNMSAEYCGDDDFSQTVFFAIPKNYNGEIFIRVFDPDCGGSYDKPNGLWETNTIFEFYGGNGCLSEFDARQTDPKGNYKSGTLLVRALFARESELDGKWVTFGPYNLKQGESIDDIPGYIFYKVIVEGRTGNDGNVYSLALSSSSNENREISNSSVFEFERTYLHNDSIKISRVESKILSDAKFSIPVILIPIDVQPDFNIIAVPLDD